MSDKIKEYHKQYYLKNRELLLSRSNEYNKLNRKPMGGLKAKRRQIKLILKKNQQKIEQYLNHT